MFTSVNSNNYNTLVYYTVKSLEVYYQIIARE